MAPIKAYAARTHILRALANHFLLVLLFLPTLQLLVPYLELVDCCAVPFCT